MTDQAIKPADDHLDLQDVQRRIKAIFIGSVGNLVEWYDFYAYTAFALYFAPAFFPNSDPVVQQLNAAVLFAATFLMRPLGGWLFGFIADRYGNVVVLQNLSAGAERWRDVIAQALMSVAGARAVYERSDGLPRQDPRPHGEPFGRQDVAERRVRSAANRPVRTPGDGSGSRLPVFPVTHRALPSARAPHSRP